MRCLFIVVLLAICLIAADVLATPGDTLKSIPCPSGYTQGMAYDGVNLWSSDRRTDMFYKFSPADGKLLDSISAPAYQITGLTFDGKWLWCVDAEAGKIYAVDPATRLVERTLDGPITQPAGLAWDGKYLWLADAVDHKIHQVDPYDGTTIISIPSPTSNPGAITFNSGYLWVADRYNDEIYMVTPDRGDVLITFPAPGSYSSGLAVIGTNLLVADYQSDRCYKLVIDDGGTFSQRDPKEQNLEYIHQIRNFGPDTVTSMQVYLAVPQDQHSQKLIGKVQFNPEPLEIVKDKWGQQIARFEFKNIPGDSYREVSMKVQCELYRNRYYIFPAKVGKLTDIPAAIRTQYTANDVKFSYDDPIIQSAVKEAVGDETNPYWIGRKIYNYVMAHMKYELSGGWNLAPTVLKRGTGSCSEYTFVYIAMCRAAGLPARYVGAITVRGDEASWDDVHHRWVEIYLPGYGWIPVDPSGGDTPWPNEQANGFGFVDNRFLVTTTSGGGSEYLDWNYNGNEKWISKGKCKVVVYSFGEWTPVTATK